MEHEAATKKPATEARKAAAWRLARAWDGASSTIRIMAGPYIGPMIELLDAMGAEIDDLNARAGATSTTSTSGAVGLWPEQRDRGQP